MPLSLLFILHPSDLPPRITFIVLKTQSLEFPLVRAVWRQIRIDIVYLKVYSPFILFFLPLLLFLKKYFQVAIFSQCISRKNNVSLPKETHTLMPRTCDYVTSHSKREFADAIKLIHPRKGSGGGSLRYPGESNLTTWAFRSRELTGLKSEICSRRGKGDVEEKTERFQAWGGFEILLLTLRYRDPSTRTGESL